MANGMKTATASVTGNNAWHSMARRAAAHDYSRPGIYHITMHVTEVLGMPLGVITGSEAATARNMLAAAGAMVEHELLTAITSHYPMITVDTYVIMPEHLHAILIVHDPIISNNGRPAHLGQVIAGFKTGCNRLFWRIQEEDTPAAKPQPTRPAPEAAAAKPQEGKDTPAAMPQGGIPGAASVDGGSAASKHASKLRFSIGRTPLFAPGYCDVMPIDARQLELQRTYIKNNPRSRWLRSHDRAKLQTQRGGIDTALTIAALRGYLKRECPPSLATPEALAQIEHRLLLADGMITCDSYGDRSLMQRRLLPVVCHRRDAARFEVQKRRCLDEAAKGAVLVSARIAKGEHTIIDECMTRGFATIAIADNGFPQIYHPSAERIDLCHEGRLLLITPWQYQYRGKNEQVTVLFCKAMNCVAQALCRTKDTWWK